MNHAPWMAPWPGVLALVILTLTGCTDVDSGTRLAEEEVRYALPTQEFTDVTLAHTEAGELVFHLTAPNLDRYDRDDRAIFYGGIEIQFYDEGKLSSTLTSEKGEVLDGGQTLLAIGHVIVTTDTGTTILTPRLKWTREDKLITSDTTVTIVSDQDTLRGTGLVASDDLKMRRILNPTGVSYRSVGENGGGLRLSGPSRSGPPPPGINPAPLSEEATVVGPSDDIAPPPPIDTVVTSPFDKQQADTATVDTARSSRPAGSGRAP